MAETNRGIFSLLDVRERQSAGTWSTRGEVWLLSSSFTSLGDNKGYFCGGFVPGGPNSTTVERIDYANDGVTGVVKGPLDAGRRYTAATANQNFGYVGGGQTPGVISSVDRVDYSNDMTIALPKGPLDGIRYRHAATGNANFGYFNGGQPGSPYKSTVERIDYANDVVDASPKGNLSEARFRHAATGNQNSGYIGGGSTPAGVADTVDRIDYSNDTVTATPKGSALHTAASFLTATGNADFGYFDSAGESLVTQRIDYSNDTQQALQKANLRATLSQRVTTGSSLFGYFGGGLGGPQSSQIDRLDYNNDTTTAAPKGPLSETRFSGAAFSASANALPSVAPGLSVKGNVAPQGSDFGYFGGNGGPKQSVIDRIDYSNDTATASPRGLLGANVENLAATGNGPFGYFGGGDADGTPGYSSKVDRVDYANDTADAAPKGPLNHGRKNHSATGNSNFGYFITGFAPSNSSYIDRVDYANDTAEALTRGNNEFQQFGTASTGNQDFGYVGGGSEGAYTHVSRIDYANDSVDSIDKGNLSSGAYQGAATGNANFGYFGGGQHAPDPTTPESRISRIDYSNDTVVSAIKGPLSAPKQNLAATGNANFGYFAGGYSPSPVVSTIERIDYASDTVDASPKGRLSRTSYLMGASSSRANGMPLKGPGILEPVEALDSFVRDFGPQGTDFGYFAGGFSPSASSEIDRVDYSNDTADALPKGKLTIERGWLGSMSNAIHGYFAGGNNSGTRYSRIDRINYSNDTTDAVIKGDILVAGVNQMQAAGTPNFGYMAGGINPSVARISSIFRLDYANDDTDSIQRAFFPNERAIHTSVGNQSFAYFAGGISNLNPSNSYQSSIERFDYSNDNVNTSPKGQLDTGRQQASGSGNADFGYVMGGTFSPLGYPGSQVDRIDYSNDTVDAITKGFLNTTTSANGATGNSSFGYSGGGQTTTSFTKHSKVQRLDYSNDTSNAVLKGPLDRNVSAHSAASSRQSAIPILKTVNYVAGTASTPNTGYFAGGGPAPGNSSNVQRIDYANDTAIMSQRGNLAEINIYGNGLGSPTHGYVCGGEGTSPSSISKVQRITYLNDTALSVFKGNLAGPSSAYDATGTDNFGYVAGPGPNIDKIVYANDTAAALEKVTLVELGFDIAAAGNQNFGYYAGGYLQKTAVNRLDYANDTVQVPARGPLNQTGGRYMAGAGNADFGYMAGGSTNSNPAGSSAIDRIDYSNDTATASPKGPLSVEEYSLDAGTGNPGFGYFGLYSKTEVERLDFSNDTATALARSPLALERNKKCAFSARENALPILGPAYADNTAAMTVTPPTNFGYFAGGTTGAPQLSTVERIDYSNDMLDPSPRGNLPVEREFVAGTGSPNFAYVGGGGPSSYTKTELFRIDYSNDSAEAAQKGFLNVGRSYFDAVGNQNFGYFLGGYKSPSALSSVERVDYSNDTAIALVRGPLRYDRQGAAAVGNADHGYIAGHAIPMVSFIDRIDYANDTVQASPKGTLTAARGYMAATGNKDSGYFGGGQIFVPNTFTELSLVDRIDYSNDDVEASPKGNLTQTRQQPAATGNKDFGYFGGGGPSNLRSSIDRVDYANDTADAPARAPFPGGVYGLAGVSAAGNGLPQ